MVRIRRHRRCAGAGLVLTALVAIGCGSSAATASPASSATSVPATQAAAQTTAPAATNAPATLPVGLNLVVVGDSIPFGGHFCPGCTAFVDTYAKAVQQRSGQQVNVENRSRDDGAGVLQIVEQVTSDAALQGDLAQADIVILSVGANNALPDSGNPPPGGFPAGCDAVAPGIADPIIGHIVATTSHCNEATAAAWAKDYDTIFTKMSELRAGKPTVFIALNAYDANIDNPDIKAAMDAATFAATEKVIVDAYDKWNTMLCKEASANGFVCVDVYHLINGPDGAQPLGDRAIDGTHPSQKGNDMIAALLAKVDASTVVH
jgi:lysophospholipase L1-like esterase